MANLTIKPDGSISSKNYTETFHLHTCSSGTRCKITLQWPEDLIINGQVTVTGEKCFCCQEPIILPKAKYFSRKGLLVIEPLDS